MSLTTNSKKESQSPVQIRRTVHRMDQGAKTTRFVLHPDQVRLAKSIDEMDGKARGAINTGCERDQATCLLHAQT